MSFVSVLPAIMLLFFIVFMERAHSETYRNNLKLRDKIKELETCNKNYHNSIQAHQRQLWEDFNIVYDAPKDLYVQIKQKHPLERT